MDITTTPTTNDHRSKILRMRYGLTPVMAVVIGLLLDLTTVSIDEITEVGMMASKMAARVLVYRMREVLEKEGIEIKQLRGIGYWIEPEQKTKILDAVDAFTAGR